MSGRYGLRFCPVSIRPEVKQTVVRGRHSRCAVNNQHGANAVPQSISGGVRIQNDVRPRRAVIIANRQSAIGPHIEGV